MCNEEFKKFISFKIAVDLYWSMKAIFVKLEFIS